MDKSKAKVPVILGVAAFLFFTVVYPNHMRFAEQYQMFLFTGEYFCSFFNRPGGFAAYLGAFFTQFAYIPALGALVYLYDFPQNGVQGIMPPYSRDFFIYVSETEIDPFLSYRKIAPGFEIHSKMGLYCRDLTSYREKVVFENTAITGSCINCHSFNAGDQSQVTLHVRGTKGGTLIRDGKTLFFARARLRPMPDEYDDARYNLCCTSFEDGKIGYEIRTLVDAEADSWRILDEVCSPETDSWHSWSSNGSGWFCFASRRDDGLHTRVYFSMINPDGTATKPFMLPQRSPDKYYTRLFYSYNIPEFSSSEFKLDIDDLTQEKKTIGQR